MVSQSNTAGDMQPRLGYWPNTFNETYGTDDHVSFGIEATPEVFKEIEQWLRLKHSIQPFDYEINFGSRGGIYETEGDIPGTYVGIYEFSGISPVIVGLRLALSAPTLIKDDNISADRKRFVINMYLTYCENLIEICDLMLLPKFGFGSDNQPIYKELIQWAEQCGIGVYNLNLFPEFPPLPLTGRIMFIWYEEHNQDDKLVRVYPPSRFLMPIVMFLEKSDAMLFKLVFHN